MKLKTISIDVVKNVFQVCAVNAHIEACYSLRNNMIIRTHYLTWMSI
ncbi:MAG: hypothetical protein ACJA13_003220 [Paraglaciecola sp.]|jgi:hypothetical protein